MDREKLSKFLEEQYNRLNNSKQYLEQQLNAPLLKKLGEEEHKNLYFLKVVVEDMIEIDLNQLETEVKNILTLINNAYIEGYIDRDHLSEENIYKIFNIIEKYDTTYFDVLTTAYDAVCRGSNEVYHAMIDIIIYRLKIRLQGFETKEKQNLKALLDSIKNKSNETIQ